MNEPAIAVAVMLPDGSQRFIERGQAVFEHGIPANDSTVFNVGSVAKQFTAYLVLLAARRGALDLEEKAEHYLPRLAVPGITIAQLLTHTSGLRDAEAMLSLCGYRELDHYTGDDLLNLAYRQRERAVRPETFLYSNTNYQVLAKILETVHGDGFTRLAQKEIFAPLGMSATSFRDDTRTVVPNAAASYEHDHGHVIHAGRPVALAGPGSLWTNPRDLLIWLAELHATWTCEERTFPFEPSCPHAPCDNAGHLYGPGLFARTNGSPAVFHNGHEHGFSASTYVGRDGLAVACAANAAWVQADRVATAIVSCPEGDLDAVITKISAGAAHPTVGNHERGLGSRSVEVLGAYTAPELPGIIRIGRVDGTLVVLRRGTVDSLAAIGPSGLAFQGAGLVVTFPTPPTKRAPSSFVLDLDRAPAITYWLTEHP